MSSSAESTLLSRIGPAYPGPVIDVLKPMAIRLKAIFRRNQSLYKMIVQHTFIAGGAITDIYQKKLPKDYDFFFSDSLSASKFREYMISLGVGYREGCWEIVCITENAVTIKVEGEKPYYQFVTKWSGSPLMVVAKFDLIHSMAYFDPWVTQFSAHKDMPYLVENGILRISDAYQGEVNEHRLAKFLHRGWHLESDSERGWRLLNELNIDDQKANS